MRQRHFPNPRLLSSVVVPNKLNLDPNPVLDPRFGPNLDPDPDPDPDADPGLHHQF